jgi:hypothetical protein
LEYETLGNRDKAASDSAGIDAPHNDKAIAAVFTLM